MYKNNSNKVGILSMLFFEDHVIRHRKKYRFIYVESTGVNMQDKHYLGQKILFYFAMCLNQPMWNYTIYIV